MYFCVRAVFFFLLPFFLFSCINHTFTCDYPLIALVKRVPGPLFTIQPILLFIFFVKAVVYCANLFFFFFCDFKFVKFNEL